jgi:hypothetical protein
MRQQVRRDVSVILEQVTLGYSQLWPKWLCEVSELYYSTLNLYFKVLFVFRNN